MLRRAAGRRFGMRRAGLVLAMFGLLAGCAGSVAPQAGRPGDAEPAWLAAMLILPGDRAAQRMIEAVPRLAALGPSARLPVVVFAHGCRGFDAAALETLGLLAAHGFAVIAPDHLARADAALSCGAGAASFAMARPVRRDGGFARAPLADPAAAPAEGYARRRIEEVELALSRVRALPWADPGAIYLVGHGLGRGTAALWPTRGLAAVALLGQDCRGPGPALAQELPLSVPMLPLAARGDTLPVETLRARHCGEDARHPQAGELLIGPPGREADPRPETQRALLRFLLGAPRA
jgi:dienelactone hydrolase